MGSAGGRVTQGETGPIWTATVGPLALLDALAAVKAGGMPSNFWQIAAGRGATRPAATAGP